jgi:hypothetical protein
MARLLIEVTDPLDLDHAGNDRKPLLLGEIVRVDIAGRVVDKVFAVPRDAVREGRWIWLLDSENRLRIEEPEVVWRDAELALLRGLNAGDRVIISDLATPVENMELDVVNPPDEARRLAADGGEQAAAESPKEPGQ